MCCVSFSVLTLVLGRDCKQFKKLFITVSKQYTKMGFDSQLYVDNANSLSHYSKHLPKVTDVVDEMLLNVTYLRVNAVDMYK